ncbi:ribokinase [Amycolatopsis mediterranei S699]|uniref:Ribokinase n=2 Tax=Amycolatopsis mediterranei TaxID=33910 RepID=A0A0H3DMB5_AMYMU|nr:PfkB family carbohydrate kinase [Amycolatopsis mediterranei]ADJ50824.1 ribokinase [Amycolatopsis mediterranei U32]AEK47836.1 ribokinase [Amycolatopsis mediterranei S699]AFO82530.1 ribokinase [Amycolatopsis mediterranei S699]AGT89659.1 ribokinase [Amycolatopsis mediterranei RB]KDO12182.1 ribokinase [Amycolatopsis mediterranei]
MLLAGLCTVDLVQRVEELPAPGEKVQSLQVDVAAGGPATNAAVTAAALGAEATLLTVLGAHPLAALARADLETHGVRVVDLDPGRTEPPPVSAVAVRDRDGERTVVSRNAAGSEATWDGTVDADVVLVDGHHPGLALSVARAAGDVPVVLDTGSWKPVLDELLPLVDVAACSAHFTAPEPGLHERGVPTVITTAGPHPVRWSTADGGSGEVPVAEVEARDTLGAGDVWHGALAVAVTRERTVTDRIRFANEVAAERVRHVGPRSWTTAIAGRNRT